MKFENSTLYTNLKFHKLQLEFGTYYLCDSFVIGELNAGVHFDFNKADIIAEEIIKHYGEGPKLNLIANRIHSYSVEPQNWTRVLKKYPDLLCSSCVVAYNTMSTLNASLENRFFIEDILLFNSLEDAVLWAQRFKK
ncbi:hypothetical protein Q2T40_11730 [Winogradskyella maritima]|uniref:STAS/SEC14 domain-containing protein n=1 Tax=Winogradskyella maritima TaxID=1517766 RepID=A0ABV8AIJ8_9FLAO|nr:hypothetical protein [Winogradskyella maritima]